MQYQTELLRAILCNTMLPILYYIVLCSLALYCTIYCTTSHYKSYNSNCTVNTVTLQFIIIIILY